MHSVNLVNVSEEIVNKALGREMAALRARVDRFQREMSTCGCRSLPSRSSKNSKQSSHAWVPTCSLKKNKMKNGGKPKCLNHNISSDKKQFFRSFQFNDYVECRKRQLLEKLSNKNVHMQADQNRRTIIICNQIKEE